MHWRLSSPGPPVQSGLISTGRRFSSAVLARRQAAPSMCNDMQYPAHHRWSKSANTLERRWNGWAGFGFPIAIMTVPNNRLPLLRIINLLEFDFGEFPRLSCDTYRPSIWRLLIFRCISSFRKMNLVDESAMSFHPACRNPVGNRNGFLEAVVVKIGHQGSPAPVGGIHRSKRRSRWKRPLRRFVLKIIAGMVIVIPGRDLPVKHIIVIIAQ